MVHCDLIFAYLDLFFKHYTKYGLCRHLVGMWVCEYASGLTDVANVSEKKQKQQIYANV